MSEPNDQFRFTITDAARFLGKSPVTLRSWETKGDVAYPRNEKGDRVFTAHEIRKLAWLACAKKRLTDDRARLVDAAMTMLEIIERR